MPNSFIIDYEQSLFRLRIVERNELHVRDARGGGGDSHMKVTGMLVVPLRAVDCRFWSHLGC